MRQALSTAEKLAGSWEAVVSTSTTSLSALVNVCLRRAASGSDTQSRAASAAKLEHYMGSLVKSLAVMRDICDRLNECTERAYESLVVASDGDASGEWSARTSTEAGTADVLECLQYAAQAHEAEYWHKVGLREAIDYNGSPEALDTTLREWSEEPRIDRALLRSLIRRASGTQLKNLTPSAL